MKKLVMIVAAAAVLLPASLWAADAPKADVFGGFSWLSIKDEGDTSRFNPVGWQASVAGHINEKFAIVGDVGGQYKDGLKIYEYVGGPRVTHRLDKASVFAHAMFGGHHVNENQGSGFTMVYGGGVDVKATDKVDIRVVQFDWAPSRDNGVWTKNIIRLGFGVVFKISK